MSSSRTPGDDDPIDDLAALERELAGDDDDLDDDLGDDELDDDLIVLGGDAEGEELTEAEMLAELGDRLGEATPTLRAALEQIRLAFVQVKAAATAP